MKEIKYFEVKNKISEFAIMHFDLFYFCIQFLIYFADLSIVLLIYQ